MILEGIASVIFGIINGFLSLLPNGSILGGITPSIKPLIDTINFVSCIMPVDTFVLCLGIWLVLANLSWLVGTIKWVVNKLPGVNW